MIRHVSGAPGHDVWITCGQCEATWLGQPFDDCEWCSAVGADIERREIERILFPEFLNWDQRFAILSPVAQRVWALTRGFGGEYEATWIRKLHTAFGNSRITQTDVNSALGRYRQWKATQLTQSSKNYES